MNDLVYWALYALLFVGTILISFQPNRRSRNEFVDLLRDLSFYVAYYLTIVIDHDQNWKMSLLILCMAILRIIVSFRRFFEKQSDIELSSEESTIGGSIVNQPSTSYNNHRTKAIKFQILGLEIISFEFSDCIL